MKKTLLRWVNFYSPGSFTADTRRVDLPAYVEPSAVKWPDNAYAFTMNEQTVIELDGELYEGKVRRCGPMFYHPDSVVQTLEEAERDSRRTDILIENMRSNKWDRIIWTRWGNWPQPFDPEQSIVLPRSNPEGT